MSYKKLSKNIKGFKLEWEGDNIFPNYPNTSGSYVSQKRINKVKNIVINILVEEEEKILNAFKTLAKKKYKNKKIKIELNLNLALNKVNNTFISKFNDDLHGESDDNKIWISRNKLNDQELVGTILHESLHYICTFNSNDICSKDEHYVMNILGDNC